MRDDGGTPEMELDASGADAAAAPVPVRPLFKLDAGWLFLIAGIAVVGSVVLIPAAQDLAETRWERDRALTIEGHRHERLARYGQYIDGLRRGDEAVLLSLAAAQQNKTTIDRFPLYTPPNPRTTSASVLPTLEPPRLQVPEKPRQASLLGRLATGDGTRLWVMAAGMIAILLGLVIGWEDESAAEADEQLADGVEPVAA